MMHVDQKPCSTCPYRRDVPPGVWHPDEYQKLRRYDDLDRPEVATFLCHGTKVTGRETVCRGWLNVHADSIAVRLLVIKGKVDPAAPFEDTGVPLYNSGNEAADAGLAGCEDHSMAARKAIDKMKRRGFTS